MKITEKDLLRLDFKRVDVPKDEGWDEDFFYFVSKLESSRGYPLLITGDNGNDSYSVEINELDGDVVIKDLDDLKMLIEIIKRNERKPIKTS